MPKTESLRWLIDRVAGELLNGKADPALLAQKMDMPKIDAILILRAYNGSLDAASKFSDRNLEWDWVRTVDATVPPDGIAVTLDAGHSQTSGDLVIESRAWLLAVLHAMMMENL